MPFEAARQRRILNLARAVLFTALCAGCSSSQRTQPDVGALRGSATDAPHTTSPGAVSPVLATREWRWETIDGLEVDTSHWTIRTSLRGTMFASTLPSFYEAALANFRTGLVPLPAPPKRLEAFVFGTRDEWARYTVHRLGADAGAYLKMGRGGFTTDGEAVLYDIGPADTRAIAAHEGWHQYSQTTLKSALPVWLEEGVACYMEGHRQPPGATQPTFLPWRNVERYTELRNAARRDHLATLRELLDGSPQTFLERSKDAQLAYYAQVWALIHFLREGEGGKYRAGLAQLMDDAVQGHVAAHIRACEAIPAGRAREAAARAHNGPWIVLAYFDADFESFSRAYDRFLGVLVESNAWDRVMRGENPVAPAAAPVPAP